MTSIEAAARPFRFRQASRKTNIAVNKCRAIATPNPVSRAQEQNIQCNPRKNRNQIAEIQCLRNVMRNVTIIDIFRLTFISSSK